MIRVGAAVLVAGATAGFATAGTAMAGTLVGNGSTLVQPLLQKWVAGWDGSTGNTVTYTGTGSGTGVTDITSAIGDFGASDAPLSEYAAASNCPACVQIPWALSATGISYNLSGITRLKLSASVLAGIYEGTITNWDAPQITKLNKGVKLPSETITPIYRTDSSGDTFAFTSYLTDVSPAWKSIGAGTKVQFPHGVGGAKNAGVLAVLQSTPGSIGYIAVPYLLSNNLPAAAVQNAAGNFEYPNLSNIENAASIVKSVPANNQVTIVDPPKKAKIAYPISTFTYVIAPTNAPQGGLLQQFIRYALGKGQADGPQLDFAPLPKDVLKADLATVAKIS
jgi:phosphate transport system substrate-binding protein